MEANTNLDLILFKEAIEHIMRISRIVFLSDGHMMLLGQHGLGKKSLTNLASSLVGA